MILLVVVAVGCCVAAACKARAADLDLRLALMGSTPHGHADGPGESAGSLEGRMGRWSGAIDVRVLALAAGFTGSIVLGRLTGPVGWPAGAVGGAALPIAWRRRRQRSASLRLEAQLADLVESCALAVRTGLSISQALEFAAGEAEAPMRDMVARVFRRQRLGVPFESAVQVFAGEIGTDDGRLFVLVVTIHARSGGDLAGALDEVGTTIRHRIAVRRELRALSAQGRVSGGVLGSLPLLFFLVLAATSRSELEPVYHSAAGIAMIGGGLAMQALAYLWVRRLLRVEV